MEYNRTINKKITTMKIRQLLIIIVTVLIFIAFGITSSISYDMGVTHGVTNAETIRESKITDSLIHETTIKTVNAIKIINSDIHSEIKSSGRVVSLNNITITSEVGGKINGNFSIKKGTNFKKGDVLFKIKNTEIKLLVEAKKSNFMNLISNNLADIKLDYPQDYIKWENFFNSISFNTPISKLPETTTSKEKNFIISRGIMAEYLSLKSDEEKLKKYTIKATFDGVISKSYTDVGANINIGSPIIDVIRKGEMEIELTVNTSEINFIEIGNTVHFTDNNNNFDGTITRKGSFVNQNTQSISVFAEINSRNQLLYNGMYLESIIKTKKNKDVCKISRRSIFSDNKIFTINSNNELEIKSINIISNKGNNVIVDNISNNTIVVSEPLINIKEGTIVNPVIK